MTKKPEKRIISIEKVEKVINKFLTFCAKNELFYEIIVKGEHGKTVFLSCSPHLNKEEEMDRIDP